jgi:hypothetical protein
MSQIWMDVDAALASVPVNTLPLVNDTDGKTIEAEVVYNQSGLALFWNFTNTAGTTTVTAVTPTSGGVHDWTDFSTSGMYGIELPASGGDAANDAEGFGHFTGVATGVLPWSGPVIGFRAAALNNALIDGGDLLDVNVTKVADTTQTANDNGADINVILSRIIGTLEAGSHNPASTAQLAVLTDWINGGRLDLLLDAIPTTAMRGTDSGPTNTQMVAAFTEIKGATWSGTDTLEGIFDASGGSTPAAIADAVWDEVQSGHTTAGTFGLYLDSEVSGAGGGTGLTASETRTALGLATANLDTQLTASATATGFATNTKQNSMETTLNAAATSVEIAALDSVVDTVKVDTAAILVDTGTTIPATIVTAQTDLNTITGSDGVTLATTQGNYAPNKVVPDVAGTAPTVSEILTTQMTEAYAADGAAPTLAQALMLIQQTLTEFAIAGTSLTIKKVDGSTTAAVLTLNDDTNPTGATRAS